MSLFAAMAMARGSEGFCTVLLIILNFLEVVLYAGTSDLEAILAFSDCTNVANGAYCSWDCAVNAICVGCQHG